MSAQSWEQSRVQEAAGGGRDDSGDKPLCHFTLQPLEGEDKGEPWCWQTVGARLGLTRKDEIRSHQSGYIIFACLWGDPVLRPALGSEQMCITLPAPNRQPCQRGKNMASFHKTNGSWHLGGHLLVRAALHLQGLPAMRIGLFPSSHSTPFLIHQGSHPRGKLGRVGKKTLELWTEPFLVQVTRVREQGGLEQSYPFLPTSSSGQPRFMMSWDLESFEWLSPQSRADSSVKLKVTGDQTPSPELSLHAQTPRFSFSSSPHPLPPLNHHVPFISSSPRDPPWIMQATPSFSLHCLAL